MNAYVAILHHPSIVMINYYSEKIEATYGNLLAPFDMHVSSIVNCNFGMSVFTIKKASKFFSTLLSYCNDDRFEFTPR